MSAREHVQAMIQRGLAMFDLEQFIADCRAARAADRSSKTICEVVRRAVSNPTGLLKALGEPDNANIKELYRTPDLSILNVVWAPRMMIMPHNHHMWAIIGVYGGREDNIFWRRIATEGAAWALRLSRRTRWAFTSRSMAALRTHNRSATTSSIR